MAAKTLAREKYTQKTEGVILLGGIYHWKIPGASYAQILEALKESELPEDSAKEISPRHAFSRACKKLRDDRVIDQVSESGDTITFQFTTKSLEEGQWDYSKEAMVMLNKDTGVITCEVDLLQRMAQGFLNEAISHRTGSDISQVIKKLFERNADIFPIKDGGVYFIPVEHNGFVAKVQKFICKLKGEMWPFPIPAGVGGESAVTNAVCEGLKKVIEGHEQNVDDFDTHTREGTIDEAAKKIKETRLKVQAYASLLEDKKEELLSKLNESEERLRKKIHDLAEDRANSPIVEEEGTRKKVFGLPVAAVLRWMGGAGWSSKAAKAVLDNLGVDISPTACGVQVKLGKNGENIPTLSLDQQLFLERERARVLK